MKINRRKLEETATGMCICICICICICMCICICFFHCVCLSPPSSSSYISIGSFEDDTEMGLLRRELMKSENELSLSKERV